MYTLKILKEALLELHGLDNVGGAHAPPAPTAASVSAGLD